MSYTVEVQQSIRYFFERDGTPDELIELVNFGEWPDQENEVVEDRIIVRDENGVVVADTGPEQEPPALAHSLNKAQLDVVEHYQSYNVPASWFIGETKPDGAVEVIAVGDALGGVDAFVWSFLIDKDGESATQEAQITEDGFSTGIEI